MDDRVKNMGNAIGSMSFPVQAGMGNGIRCTGAWSGKILQLDDATGENRQAKSLIEANHPDTAILNFPDGSKYMYIRISGISGAHEWGDAIIAIDLSNTYIEASMILSAGNSVSDTRMTEVFFIYGASNHRCALASNDFSRFRPSVNIIFYGD